MHRRRQLEFLEFNSLLPPCESPAGHSLPYQIQRALTDLVTRLLLEHAKGEMHDPRSGADDH